MQMTMLRRFSDCDDETTDGSPCINSTRSFPRPIIRLLLWIVLSVFHAVSPSVGYGTEDPLTPEERAWLKQHDGEIIVNNEAGWPPIIDTDQDGIAFGIAMDFQRLIEKKLGFKFKIDKLDRWDILSVILIIDGLFFTVFEGNYQFTSDLD